MKSSAFLPSSHFYIIRIYFNPFSKGERFIKARFRYLQLIKYFNEFISSFSNTLKQQNFFRIPKFNNNSFNYLDRSSRSRQSIARLNSFTSSRINESNASPRFQIPPGSTRQIRIQPKLLSAARRSSRVPHTHTRWNRQNNPGSNYRPGCCKTLPPFPRRTPRLKGRKTRLCRRADEPFRGESRQKPRRRQNNDVANDTVTIHRDRCTPPTLLNAISTCYFHEGLCVRERGGGERGRRHRRVSLLLASIRALPFPRKGVRKRRVTRPARERNVACTPAT